MRRPVLLLAVLLACAHGPKPVEPERWRELQTEHFVLRTDLPAGDAHRVAVELEEVRAALLAAGWHSSIEKAGRTQVIALADGRELEEYALKGIEGFVANDAFGEPIMVVNGDQDPEEQRFLKHELAHVMSNEFLVRNPRWVAEGIACYLETLRFDRKAGKVVVGEPGRERVEYLTYHPVPSFWSVMRTGREAERMSASEGWAFETSAWALVHWLVDERGKDFDAMLGRLARGEDQYFAFAASFPDLDEAAMRAGVGAWLKHGKVRIFVADAPRWTGAVRDRALPRAEVHAILADLMRLSPGYPGTPERDLRKRSLLSLALAEDPGHPLALRLAESADASAATASHPDDWRAWLLLADRNNHDLAASLRAAGLAPDNPTVLARLALAEENAGKGGDALRHAARAVELSPGRSDLLAVFATVLAANGRCPDGNSYAQRALDVLPDGAGPPAVAALVQTQKAIEEHCAQLASARNVERRLLLGAPKGCDPSGPRLGRRDVVRGPLSVAFVLHADGSVGEVTVTGDASPGALAAVKKYVQSCRYDPVARDGKGTETRWQVEFNVRK
jgi:hypothetical protein